MCEELRLGLPHHGANVGNHVNYLGGTDGYPFNISATHDDVEICECHIETCAVGGI
jgi:hypothetical protein